MAANKYSKWAGALMWLLPFTLIAPNIWLSIVEPLYTMPERVVNIVLPLGVYMLLCAVWKRIGLTTLLAFPLIFFCAFQIVLLFLYGKDIIAVDMLLNVVTTNMSEATELLRNLVPAMSTVFGLYLPPLAIAVVLLFKRRHTDRGQRRALLIAGGIVTAAGMVAFGAAYASDGGYKPTRRLFPVNIFANIGTAAKRTAESARYAETSADFAFGATSEQADSDAVVVLVIGETSRACNWQLAGYERPTNPRLSRRDGLIFYPRTLSQSNTTHKSVPLLMSHITAAEFGDSIYRVKGVVDAFKEAGFRTAWISNQERNGALIDFYGEQADSVLFLKDDRCMHYDGETVAPLAAQLSAAPGKFFATIHTYGSHFNYRDRIPEGYNRFVPDDASEASSANRRELVNAYDNTLLYTDAVLDSLISAIEATGRPAVLLYLSDHGEDLYDDSRERFLHASPTPTYYQLHVPLLVWTSESYRAAHPDKVANLTAHAGDRVCSSRSAFHTLLDLAGVATPYLRTGASLASANYYTIPALYLDDYNDAVPLELSGMKAPDFLKLEPLLGE